MTKLSFDLTEQNFDLTDVELDKAAGGRPSQTDFRFLKVTDAASPGTSSAGGDTFSGFLAALLS